MEKRKIYQILRKFFIENLSFFRYNNDKNIINLFFRFVNVFLRKRGVRLCEQTNLSLLLWEKIVRFANCRVCLWQTLGHAEGVTDEESDFEETKKCANITF